MKKIKILSAACSILLSLQALFTPVHAEYNELMEMLNRDYPVEPKEVAIFLASKPTHVAARLLKETNESKTVLYYALYGGFRSLPKRLAIATLLIELGVPLGNMCEDGPLSPQGTHPYVWACRNREFEFASWLLRRPQFDFTSRDSKGDTVADWAKDYGRTEDLKYITQKAPQLLEKKTPLRTSIFSYDSDDSDDSDDSFNPALTKGALRKTEAKTQKKPDERDWREPGTGNTRLHLAVKLNHKREVRRLLAARFDPNAVNNDGNTPLHMAAAYGLNEIAQMLLKKGADPNKKNKQFETPLWLVCYRSLGTTESRYKCAETLLDNRADPNSTNHENNTALDFCTDKHIADLLKQRGAKCHSGLFNRGMGKFVRHILPESVKKDMFADSI